MSTSLLDNIRSRPQRIAYARSTFEALQDPRRAARVGDHQRLEAVKVMVEDLQLPTYVPLLPLTFNLNGYPYTLDDHFPLEPVFNRLMPDSLTIKAGRQIGKSTFQAARGLALATSIPYFSLLYVFPLYEQVRRFSAYYVRKFIEESPIRRYWSGTGTENNILTRSFKNLSRMTFSFATLSAERVRGVSANMLSIDEIQNLNPTLIPIIKETLSASVLRDPVTGEKHGAKLCVYTGTPKSLDNAMEQCWQDSSMAEWAIPCEACRKVNYPSMDQDLDRMIGPMHGDIGEVHKGKKPGVICASSQCGRPLNPRNGFWHHRRPELITTHPGYHVPQVIMPMHYADPKAWSSLLAKRNGAENYTPAKFYNEVLGESYDLGAKLITQTDLKRAATLPWKNEPLSMGRQIAASKKTRYLAKVLGVDWGGGGEDEVSFTTAAVLGLRPDGCLDVIYGRRLLTPNDPISEAVELMKIFNAFQCNQFAHDYNGAGSMHEVFMIQSGLPIERVVPFVYYRSAAKNIVTPHPGDHEHSRSYYLLDKARALRLVCELIKLQRIRSFEYDYVNKDNRGLLSDFLSLVEAKIETARAGEVYSVHRSPAFPDDFAHSVAFGACAIYHMMQNWPNLAQIARLRLTRMQHEAMNPPNPWEGDAGKC